MWGEDKTDKSETILEVFGDSPLEGMQGKERGGRMVGLAGSGGGEWTESFLEDFQGPKTKRARRVAQGGTKGKPQST